MMLGYVPDLDIGEDDTLYPFVRNAEMSSLAYAVRETHWDGLWLVPANLRLKAGAVPVQPAAVVARLRSLADRRQRLSRKTRSFGTVMATSFSRRAARAGQELFSRFVRCYRGQARHSSGDGRLFGKSLRPPMIKVRLIATGRTSQMGTAQCLRV